MALQNFFLTYRNVEPAVQAHLVTDTNNELDEIVDIYKDWLTRRDDFAWDDGFRKSQRLLYDQQCTPSNIREFCQHLSDYVCERYFHRSGLFLSGMMQLAYDKGYNNFLLPLKRIDRNIANIGFRIKAVDGKPLHFIVDGDVGDHSLFGMYNCDAHVRGNGGRGCAAACQFSCIEIDGNANLF